MSHLDDCVCSGVSGIHAGRDQGGGSVLDTSTSVQLLHYVLRLRGYGKGSEKTDSRRGNRLQMGLDFIKFPGFSIFSLIHVIS